MTNWVETVLAEMTLTEKCSLLAGRTTWRTEAIDRLSIPAIKMSDGPNGVRGEHGAGERTPSVVLPVGIAQGASWDTELVAELGDLLGKEARRKSAHVLLAPGVNLHRTPIGGRTFEFYSEDPCLTSALAVAMIKAVQAHDVAVTVKHLVANDTEVERMNVEAVIDERTLREVYLAPFEAAVREGGAWGVMSSYIKLGGDFCAANRRLLTEILRDEWGFDGFVVSDWFGAHDTVGSALAGLNLEMPGPARIYGPHLEEKVASGEVAEATVDTLVKDLLALTQRTKASERSADVAEVSVDDHTERQLCRRAAAAGTVLVRNVHNTLPLRTSDAAPSVAVIGPNASATRIMGGGSSSLSPLPSLSILEALQERLPSLVHEPGCSIDKYTSLPSPSSLMGPDGQPGLEVRYYSGTTPIGEPDYVGRCLDGLWSTFGSLPDEVDLPCVMTIRGAYVPPVSGSYEISSIAIGPANVAIGETLLATKLNPPPKGEMFFSMGSQEQIGSIELDAGKPVQIDAEVDVPASFTALRIGVGVPVDGSPMAKAVEAARSADVAIVVVGTNDDWETEGNDRETIGLPGDQDELVRRVAEVNNRTIVVVNAGSPVCMPWVEDVGAILVPFFGGMEMANALADVVLGETDPGGRLPITFPKRLADVEAMKYYQPVDGHQTYGEGLDIGYRSTDRNGIEPLFPFGHGLSYGDASWGAATANKIELLVGESVVVSVPLDSIGDSPVTVVVQGYVAPIDPPVLREIKSLRTWAKVHLEAGQSTTVELKFDEMAFRRWDTDVAGWVIDPGEYDLHIASSSTYTHSTLRVQILGKG